jgi:hypothetical protein
MVQPNGKILVGGSTIGISERAPSTMVLVRYNSDGSLDTTFGAGGIVEAVSVVASPALREVSTKCFVDRNITFGLRFPLTLAGEYN